MKAPLKPWRVVLNDRSGVKIEYATREEARDAARRTGGIVQGYIPAVGWVHEKKISEVE